MPMRKPQCTKLEPQMRPKFWFSFFVGFYLVPLLAIMAGEALRFVKQPEEAGAIRDEKKLRVRHAGWGEQSAIPVPPRSADVGLELNLIIVIQIGRASCRERV